MLQRLPPVCLTAVFVVGAAQGLASAQSPLTALVDWKDGRVADGVGPADATADALAKRFWIGQGLRRAQIRIGDRERLFDEELEAPDQNYQTSILDMELDESSASAADHRLFVLTGWNSKSGQSARLQVLSVEFPEALEEVAHVEFGGLAPEGPFYDMCEVALIEEEQLVVIVGSLSPLDNRMVLQLYSYAPGAASLEGELPLVSEVLQALQSNQRLAALKGNNSSGSGSGRNCYRPGQADPDGS
jgi:hypothetical protein